MSATHESDRFIYVVITFHVLFIEQLCMYMHVLVVFVPCALTSLKYVRTT